MTGVTTLLFLLTLSFLTQLLSLCVFTSQIKCLHRFLQQHKDTGRTMIWCSSHVDWQAEGCCVSGCWWNDDVIKEEQLTSEISPTTIGTVCAWDFTLDPVRVSPSSALPFSVINLWIPPPQTWKVCDRGEHNSGWTVERKLFVIPTWAGTVITIIKWGKKGLKLTGESDDSHYCSLSSGTCQD